MVSIFVWLCKARHKIKNKSSKQDPERQTAKNADSEVEARSGNVIYARTDFMQPHHIVTKKKITSFT